MINRVVNVSKSDGTWGEPGVNIGNFKSKEYLVVDLPEDEGGLAEIRALISEDFPGDLPGDLPVKQVADSRNRHFEVGLFSVCNGKKELIFQHRKASELKVFSDGTWLYDAVESEDTNDKFIADKV